MPRIALTLATMMLAPTAAFALPVTPLPQSADLEGASITLEMMREQRLNAQCLRNRAGQCVNLETLIWQARFGTAEDRAQQFTAQRASLLASKGFLLSEEEPIIERAVEEGVVETPLPAAIFPMLMGLVGATLAMRLKKQAPQQG
jgi:hypothetical protein